LWDHYNKEDPVRSIEDLRANPDEPADYNKFVVNAEMPINEGHNMISKFSGFFRAPRSGEYQFMISADDRGALDIAAQEDGGNPGQYVGIPNDADRANLVNVISVDSHTGYRTYRNENQTSAKITLNAGDLYYLEAYHQENSGNDYFTLGVIIPGETDSKDALPELQRIAITDCIENYNTFTFTPSATAQELQFYFAWKNHSSLFWDVLWDRTTDSFAVGDAADAELQLARKGYESEVTIDASGQYTVKILTRVDADLVAYREDGGANKQIDPIPEHDPQVLGNFKIFANGQSSYINYNANEGQVISALRDLGFDADISVWRSGDVRDGATWDIQFSSRDGNVPQLTIDENNLQGCNENLDDNINIELSTIRDGDETVLYYEIIPQQYLSTHHDSAQITVTSNGMRATCKRSVCDYEVLTTGIPDVYSVSNTGGNNWRFLVSAIGAFTEPTVNFGFVDCTVNSYDTATTPGEAIIDVTCDELESGSHQPKVHFDDFGYASVSAAPEVISPVVSSVTAYGAEANPYGGNTLIITGSGFPHNKEIALERELEIRVDSAICDIIFDEDYPSYTEIRCITTEKDAGDTDADVTISLNGGIVHTDTSLDYMVAYPQNLVLSDTEVSPVVAFTLTIDGNNFDANKDDTVVILIDEDGVRHTDRCLPSSSTTTQIQCSFLGVQSGVYDVQVQTSKGYSSYSPSQLTAVIKVDGVSPASGSLQGGTLITISGGTFSDTVSQTQVLIGDLRDWVECDVVSSSATEVTCVTRAINEYMSADEDYEVTVATRIQEESVCDGTCHFRFSDASTPKINSLNKNVVAPGDTDFVLTGSNLAGTGTPEVAFNGQDLTVTASDATSITVTVPSDIEPGTAGVLSVRVPGLGDADFTAGTDSIDVSLVLSSISPTSGPAAGTLITVNGLGLNQGVSINVGDEECEIRSESATAITCVARNSGSVTASVGNIESVTCGSCSFSTSSTGAPDLASVAERSSPITANTFILDLQGTNIAAATDVTLVGVTDSSRRFTGVIGTVNDAAIDDVEVTFTNVVAGQYNVEVIVSGTNFASASQTVEVPATATISGAEFSSLAGGALITIDGTGFFTEKDENNRVDICGLKCEIDSQTFSQILCRAPAF